MLVVRLHTLAGRFPATSQSQESVSRINVLTSPWLSISRALYRTAWWLEDGRQSW